MNTYSVKVDKVYRQDNQIVVDASLHLGKEKIVSRSYGYPLSASKDDIERDLKRWAKNYAAEEKMRQKNEKRNQKEEKAEETIQKLKEAYNAK